MVFKEFDYDVKNEVDKYRDASNDNIYKFLLYKLTAVNDGFDCDRSDYTKRVYSKLWGFDVAEVSSFQNVKVGEWELLMGMDTMNSYWTTFAWALNRWCLKDLKESFGITRVTLKSSAVLLDNYPELKRILIKNLSKEIYDELNRFALLTHTIGNFTLIPKTIKPHTGKQSFNQARASKFNDYFNLSLEWLLNNDDEVWRKDVVNEYFDTFLIRGLYIDKYNKIIPFNETQSKILKERAKIDNRPQSKEDLLLLIKNINDVIIIRGTKMKSMLEDEVVDNLVSNVSQEVNAEKTKTNIFNPFKFIENKYEAKMFAKFATVHLLIQGYIWINLYNLMMISHRFSYRYTKIVVSTVMKVAIPLVLAYAIARLKMYLFYKASLKENKVDIKIRNYTKRELIKMTASIFGVWIVISTIGLFMLQSHLGKGLGDSIANYYTNSQFMDVLVNLVVLVHIVALPTLWGFLNRCRNCHSLRTLDSLGLERTSEEDVSIKTILASRNTNNEVVGTQEQWIPGTRVSYKRHFRCNRCGQNHYSTFTEDYSKT